uniref:Uncharacterized protein n=1 Tax=Ciona intestinalis TaxID=7719 RepID=F6URZ4_CIOIN
MKQLLSCQLQVKYQTQPLSPQQQLKQKPLRLRFLLKFQEVQSAVTSNVATDHAQGRQRTRFASVTSQLLESYHQGAEVSAKPIVQDPTTSPGSGKCFVPEKLCALVTRQAMLKPGYQEERCADNSCKLCIIRS